MKRTVFNEEHEALRETARNFFESKVTPRIEEFIEDKAIPRDVWREAGKLGLLGLEVPEQYGGGGADDWRFTAVVVEEAAKVSAATASCYGIHADVLAPYMTKLTTDEQKERWLPQYCTGELWTAIGMTEPSGGSDLANLRTSATDDGDAFIVNGSKTFITNGYSAELVVTAVKTDPEKGARGISLLAIETGMEGFTRGRKLDKVGQTESDTAELFFDNVRVPKNNLIGELNNGFIHMMSSLPQERLSCATANMAHARQIFEETKQYAKDRVAFGQSIGNFQANKFTIAEIETELEVAQAYVDKCILAHAEGTLTEIDAAKAKWYTADIENSVLDRCVQLHGGYGFMNEYRVGRAWRDARVSRIWAGSNEIMKELIGRSLGF